jgi:membrane-associated protease RseP (regulator of RpoE activity)
MNHHVALTTVSVEGMRILTILKNLALVVLILGMLTSGYSMIEGAFSSSNLGLMVGIGFVLSGMSTFLLGNLIPLMDSISRNRNV